MKFLKTLLVFPLVFMLGDVSIAQVQRSMSFDANTNLLLREFSAMLVQAEDQIQVEMKLGSQPGSTSANSDELQRGDLILMMNGQRVKDVPGMREIYEGLSDGEEIKIGVRRGDERFIVSGKKGDFPESGGQQMVMSFESDSDSPPVVIGELGILLSTTDEGVVVQALIEPLLPADFASHDLEGAKILSINDEEFETAEAVRDFLSVLAVGDELSLLFEKDGDEIAITLEKPAARAGISLGVDN